MQKQAICRYHLCITFSWTRCVSMFVDSWSNLGEAVTAVTKAKLGPPPWVSTLMTSTVFFNKNTGATEPNTQWVL